LLNGWVFKDVFPQVAMGAGGATLLAWSIALVVERPGFSWAALRSTRVPSLVSGGRLARGPADWVGEPGPGEVRVQLGLDCWHPGRQRVRARAIVAVAARRTTSARAPTERVRPRGVCAGGRPLSA
jgi:hypothetical protein